MKLLLVMLNLFGLIVVASWTSAAYWIEGPASPLHRDYQTSIHYDAPICPPGFVPEFFGVQVVDGVSRPIYRCEYSPDAHAQRIGWDEFASTTPTPG